MNKVNILSVVVLAIMCVACTRPSAPKPYGYFRIAIPEHEYISSASQRSDLPFTFALSSHAAIQNADSANHQYFNIQYPTLNATIHCSYLPIHHNLAGLLADANEMVYSHTVKASAIPEQEYVDSANRVFGMLYELQGNTATPAQFYLTDSTRHFLRCAVYVNTIPNQDSLAPIIDYLRMDVRTMMESLRWQP